MQRVALRVVFLTSLLCISSLYPGSPEPSSKNPKGLLEIVVSFIAKWAESHDREEIAIYAKKHPIAEDVYRKASDVLAGKLYRLMRKNNFYDNESFEAARGVGILYREKITASVNLFPLSFPTGTSSDKEYIYQVTLSNNEFMQACGLDDLVRAPLYWMHMLMQSHVEKKACELSREELEDTNDYLIAQRVKSEEVPLDLLELIWRDASKNKRTRYCTTNKIVVQRDLEGGSFANTVDNIQRTLSKINFDCPGYFLINSIWEEALKNKRYTCNHEDTVLYNKLPKSIQDILDPYTTKNTQLHDNTTHIVHDDNTQALSNTSYSIMGINCTIS